MSCRDISPGSLSLNQQNLTDEALLEKFIPIYKIFNQVDWMLLRDKSVIPFKTVNELQAPISKKYENQLQDTPSDNS